MPKLEFETITGSPSYLQIVGGKDLHTGTIAGGAMGGQCFNSFTDELLPPEENAWFILQAIGSADHSGINPGPSLTNPSTLSSAATQGIKRSILTKLQADNFGMAVSVCFEQDLFVPLQPSNSLEEPLIDQEIDILGEILHGNFTARSIASQLKEPTASIEISRHSLLQKLKARTQCSVIMAAYLVGIFEPIREPIVEPTSQPMIAL